MKARLCTTVHHLCTTFGEVVGVPGAAGDAAPGRDAPPAPTAPVGCGVWSCCGARRPRDRRPNRHRVVVWVVQVVHRTPHRLSLERLDDRVILGIIDLPVDSPPNQPFKVLAALR